eukprot:CAMPEP_0117884484 /NCGR_PEP_ID=MMETSP0950-20121206/18919_1 /TAXON_ID=44440 /ORGANISM="Chattonella subsalsa, Strain CCMP2191" /LENGTH=639 /DNA_ID=CAMNT_0005740883 /DNA_START=21 /DNA_END=1940 /DNA_ORIENTATION=-
MLEKVHREINCQKRLSHPHVVRLYELIDTPTYIFVVLEYCPGGELFDYIVSRGKLEVEDARRMFQQLIGALEYIHHHKVVHRDLKPENILLDERGNIKIADFGLCNTTKDGDFIKTSCGSPNYAAPEVISNCLYAGPEVDVWSVGVIFYALMCGSLPFDDDNIPNLFKKIKSGFFYMPSHLSNMAKDLISRMLTVDPLKRITIADIRMHPWFQTRLPGYLCLTPDEVDTKYMEVEDDLLQDVANLNWNGIHVTAEDVRRAVLDEEDILHPGSTPQCKLSQRTSRKHPLAKALNVTYFILREKQRQRSCWEDLAERHSEASNTPPAFTPIGAGYMSDKSEGMDGSRGRSNSVQPQRWMEEAHARSLMEATQSAFGVQVPPPPSIITNSQQAPASPYAIARTTPRNTTPRMVGVAPGSSHGQKSRRRWFLGIQSKKEGIHIMMELFRIIYMLGGQWRQIQKKEAYRLHVAWKPNAPRPPQASFINFPDFCNNPPKDHNLESPEMGYFDSSENLQQLLQQDTNGGERHQPKKLNPSSKQEGYHPGGGSSPSQDYFDVDYALKFGLALYKLDQGLYLLDFWLVEGQAFFFMQLCATIIMNLKKGSARVQRAKLADEGLLPTFGRPEEQVQNPLMARNIPQVSL